MDEDFEKKIEGVAEIAPFCAGEDSSLAGPATEPTSAETVEAKPDALPTESPLLDCVPDPFPGPVTPGEKGNPDPTPETNSGGENDQLSKLSTLLKGTLTRSATSATKHRLFGLDWAQLGQIEVKRSTDPQVLLLSHLLGPRTESDLLRKAGLLPQFGMFPPQGYFTKGKKTFVAVLDWGLIEEVRPLLDPETEIPVVAYSSATAVKVSGLYQLATYHQLRFAPNRESLRAEIIALHQALLPAGSEYLGPATRIFLAALAGRHEGALRRSEKGARRKQRAKRQEPTASGEPEKAG